MMARPSPPILPPGSMPAARKPKPTLSAGGAAPRPGAGSVPQPAEPSMPNAHHQAAALKKLRHNRPY